MSSELDRDNAARKPGLHAVPVCDLCGAPLVRAERRRLVWDSGVGGDLVLADLCAACASESDRLLQLYGGRGRDRVRLVQEVTAHAAAEAPLRRIGGVTIRVLAYILIALAAFVVVTLVTSRG